MGGEALFAHSWFLEPTPSAPQMWEHCRWWLTQITVSAFLSTSLDLHCYWLSASINVSFFTHLTFMSPLVFLLTPLAPRIVSFDFPKSFLIYKQMVSANQVRSLPFHITRNDITTTSPLFCNDFYSILILF